MRLTTPPEFQSEAMLTGMDFALIDRLLRIEAEEQGFDIHNGHGRSTWCETEQGEFGAKKRGENVLVFARAHRPEWLSSIQDSFTQHISETLPEAARLLRWSSLADAGKPPANFSLARVESVQRISQDFLRLRLMAPDLARLATTDSIHFRLVLPRDGDSAPEWPRLGANGQVQWPKGDKALHRPVYTVRAIDATAGWLDADIFLHPGGRVAEWALSHPIGARIGLLGPSGGGIPAASDLILAGDETAYPAMARIIETRPGALGQAWLLGKNSDYPMPAAKHISVTPLPGGAKELVALLRKMPPKSSDYIWMATEKAQIEQLKHVLIETLAHERHQTHLAAYWTETGLPSKG